VSTQPGNWGDGKRGRGLLRELATWEKGVVQVHGDYRTKAIGILSKPA
jgi:hypothetical protein